MITSTLAADTCTKELARNTRLEISCNSWNNELANEEINELHEGTDILVTLLIETEERSLCVPIFCVTLIQD